MINRLPRSRPTSGLAATTATVAIPIAILFLTVGPAGAGAQDLQTGVTVDTRLAGNAGNADALPGTFRSVSVLDVMDGALAVRHDGDEPTWLVMFTVRIRDGRAVASHQGKAFEVAPGETFYPSIALVVPDRRFFGGEAYVDADGIVDAGRPVPADHGTDENPIPGSSAVSFVVNGYFPGKPADWRNREAVYVVAVTADPELRRSTVAQPVALFLKR